MAEHIAYGERDYPIFEWEGMIANQRLPTLKMNSEGLILKKLILPEFFYTRAVCKTKRKKKLPDIFIGAGSMPIVSRRLHDLIIDLEPDIHSFFPIDMLRNDLVPFDGGPYYVFFCMRRIDAILLRKSKLKVLETYLDIGEGKKIPRTSIEFQFEFSKELQENYINASVSKSRISGLHIWKPAYQMNFRGLYVSDELASVMRKSNINNVRFFHLTESDEQWLPEENLLREQIEKYQNRTWGVLKDPNAGENTTEPLWWITM